MNKIITLVIGFTILIGAAITMYFLLSVPNLKDSQIEQILGAGIFSGIIGSVIIVLGFQPKTKPEELCDEQHELAHA
ncbi:MAG: hypothetical protein WCO58_00350 [bacterium]